MTLRDEGQFVRRLAAVRGEGAASVDVQYKSGGLLLRSTLNADDLARIRRVVALYDMDELPPPPPPPEYKDGEVMGDQSEGVKEPTIIPRTKVVPVFPARARAAHKAGRVVLMAHILKDGTIGSLVPVEITPGGCGFAEAAMEGVKQWKYHPATKAGEPVEVDYTIVVDFV